MIILLSISFSHCKCSKCRVLFFFSLSLSLSLSQGKLNQKRNNHLGEREIHSSLSSHRDSFFSHTQSFLFSWNMFFYKEIKQRKHILPIKSFCFFLFFSMVNMTEQNFPIRQYLFSWRIESYVGKLLYYMKSIHDCILYCLLFYLFFHLYHKKLFCLFHCIIKMVLFEPVYIVLWYLCQVLFTSPLERKIAWP